MGAEPQIGQNRVHYPVQWISTIPGNSQFRIALEDVQNVITVLFLD